MYDFYPTYDGSEEDELVKAAELMKAVGVDPTTLDFVPPAYRGLGSRMLSGGGVELAE